MDKAPRCLLCSNITLNKPTSWGYFNHSYSRKNQITLLHFSFHNLVFLVVDRYGSGEAQLNLAVLYVPCSANAVDLTLEYSKFFSIDNALNYVVPVVSVLSKTGE